MTSEPVAQAIVCYLRQRLPDMLALRQQLARLDDPSTVRRSQQAVLRPLADSLRELQYTVHLISGQQTGGHLYARSQQRAKQQPIQLLLGHCDTVWPLGTLVTMPLELEEGILRGPGVYDMKAGLVQMLYAVRALHELQVEPAVTPVIFINSDEEIGSRESTRYIRRLARIA